MKTKNSNALQAIEQGRRDGKLQREFHRRVAAAQRSKAIRMLKQGALEILTAKQ